MREEGCECECEGECECEYGCEWSVRECVLWVWCVTEVCVCVLSVERCVCVECLFVVCLFVVRLLLLLQGGSENSA